MPERLSPFWGMKVLGLCLLVAIAILLLGARVMPKDSRGVNLLILWEFVKSLMFMAAMN